MTNCVILAGGEQRRMNGDIDKITFCQQFIPDFVQYEYATEPGAENSGTLYNWLSSNLHREKIAQNPLLIVNGDVVADPEIWEFMLSPIGADVWLIRASEMKGGFMWLLQPSHNDLVKATMANNSKWVEYSLAQGSRWTIKLTNKFITDVDTENDVKHVLKHMEGKQNV